MKFKFWENTETFIMEIPLTKELPLEVWSFLVKQRANNRCEECRSKKKLLSHHKIFRPEGKNTLENGQCLCSKHHAQKHDKTIEVPAKYLHSNLLKQMGKRHFKKYILSEIEKIEEWTCSRCTLRLADLNSNDFFKCSIGNSPTKGECRDFRRDLKV